MRQEDRVRPKKFSVRKNVIVIKDTSNKGSFLAPQEKDLLVPHHIYGFDGDDHIKGSLRDDFIVGGAGNDLLAGNFGNDVYAYNASFRETGHDTINDLKFENNRILITDLTFEQRVDVVPIGTKFKVVWNNGESSVTFDRDVIKRIVLLRKDKFGNEKKQVLLYDYNTMKFNPELNAVSTTKPRTNLNVAQHKSTGILGLQ